MPGLISSSSSAGPRAAPKATSRRRPGQNAAATVVKPNPIVPVAVSGTAPPSPPPTQPQAPSDPRPSEEGLQSSGRVDPAPGVHQSSNDRQDVAADVSQEQAPLTVFDASSGNDSHTVVDGNKRASPLSFHVSSSQGRLEAQQLHAADEQVISPGPSQIERSADQPVGDESQSVHGADASNSPNVAGADVLGKRQRADGLAVPGAQTAKRTRRSPVAPEIPPQSSLPLEDYSQSSIPEVDRSSQGNGQVHEVDPGMPAKKRRQARNNGGRNEGGRAIDDETTPTGNKASKPKKPRQRKKPPAASKADGPVSEQIVQTTEGGHDATGDTATPGTKEKGSGAEKRRQKKSAQPVASPNLETNSPDPELHEIDPHELSMWELSHDTTRGKTSELGRRMAAIDWKEVALKRRLEESGIAVTPDQTGSGVLLTSTAGQNAEAIAEAAEAVITETNGESGDIELQMDADGNIIANDDALVRVMNAEAEAAANSGAPVMEENPLTTRLNRTTWVNANKRDPADRVPMWKGKSDPWSEDETDRFYEALGMFGTDFFIISKMFPPKTRRMIKMKFVREERLDPDRINRTLLGMDKKPMDLEHYARETGRDVAAFSKYATVEEADAAMREELKGTAARMTATIEQEAANAEDQEEQERLRQQERSRGGRRGKKGRQMEGGGIGGGGPDDG